MIPTLLPTDPTVVLYREVVDSDPINNSHRYISFDGHLCNSCAACGSATSIQISANVTAYYAEIRRDDQRRRLPGLERSDVHLNWNHVDVPANHTPIGSNSVASCSSLKTLTFADRTSDITLYTQLWYGNQALTTITLVNGMTSTSYQSFYDCCGTSLTSLTIPASATSILDQPFKGLSSLQTLAISPRTQHSLLCTHLSGAFQNCVRWWMPSFLPALPVYAFAQTNSLAVVTIPDFVRVQKALLDTLGVRKVHASIGVSMGGLQSYEWAARFPDLVERVIAVDATTSQTSYAIAALENWSGPIRVDQHWNNGDYYGGPEPLMGVAQAFFNVVVGARHPEYMAAAFGHKWAAAGKNPLDDYRHTFLSEQVLKDAGMARAHGFTCAA
eukprot:gene39247-48481_t